MIPFKSLSKNPGAIQFPPDIIAHAVWLYFRFSLSFRDVEDLLAQRGITVTYETNRLGTAHVIAPTRTDPTKKDAG